MTEVAAWEVRSEPSLAGPGWCRGTILTPVWKHFLPNLILTFWRELHLVCQTDHPKSSPDGAQLHSCTTLACFSQRQEHVWLQGQVRPPRLFQGCGHSHTAQRLLHQPLQDSSGASHCSWLKATPQRPEPMWALCWSCVCPPGHSSLPPVPLVPLTPLHALLQSSFSL